MGVYIHGEAREKVKDVFLKLEYNNRYKDSVILVAVDPVTGERIPGGILVEIRGKRLSKVSRVWPSLGFDLDSWGKIKDIDHIYPFESKTIF